MTLTDPQAAAVDSRPTDEPLPDAARRDGGDRDDLVEEDLLVEDVSIDGMCGVY